MSIDLLRWAPKRTFSAAVGACARTPIPRRLRVPLLGAWAHRTGVDLGEVERALDDYPTLDAFFTRRLRPGARPIAKDLDAITSPCDGVVTEQGISGAGRLVQAKGKTYALTDLLGDSSAAARFEGGSYLTIYLSPRDYHRVHFAVEGTVTRFHHIAGARFPVNQLAVRHIGGLYVRNERVITYQTTPVGEVATVMVGATAVGHITLAYHPPCPVKRGAELGAFHLGSTVVLLFQPGRIQLEPLTEGQRLRLGEVIARRKSVDVAA